MLVFLGVLGVCGGLSGYADIRRRNASRNENDPTIFHRYELVSKQSVSSTCSILTLKSQTDPNLNLYRDAWEKGVWSLQIKQPQLQIARSYTPLPPLSDRRGGQTSGWDDDDDDEEFDSTELRFLIRREPHGEVSGYLHGLPLGAVIHVRGPSLEYELCRDDIDEVLFIAGGTGIAPALQVAHSLLKYRGSGAIAMPKLRILWANRRREDALEGVSDRDMSSYKNPRPRSWTRLFWAGAIEQQQQPLQQQPPLLSSLPPHQASLVTEIERFKRDAPGKIAVDYFFDEEGSFITQDILKNYLAHHREKGSPEEAPLRCRKLILVSGPDGFVTHLAGPKVWMGKKNQSQGPLGGILKDVIAVVDDNTTRWDVWKL